MGFEPDQLVAPGAADEPASTGVIARMGPFGRAFGPQPDGRAPRPGYNVDANGMEQLGKSIVILGLVLVAVGAVLMFSGRLPFRIGRLPGDFLFQGKNTTFYFPLATGLLLSILLSVIAWLFRSR
jgi:hypothetical protein